MSSSPAALVSAFHTAFHLVAQERPAVLPAEAARQRQRLLEEEVTEVAAALRSGQLEEIAHELADLVYVAYGTALAYGIDLDALLDEVHRANMTKLGDEGRPVVRDGKVVKSTRFQRPDVAAVLRAQGWPG